MSATTKVVLALCVAAFASACNRQPEPAPVAPAPVVAEPTFTGKYN